MAFSNGINADKQAYGHGTKMISVMDILAEGRMTYGSIRNSVQLEPAYEKVARVNYNDLVFVRSSETPTEAGWAKAYSSELPAVHSGFTIRGKRLESYDGIFLESYLNTIGRHQLNSFASGSTHFNIGQSALTQTTVSFPLLSEQRKISDLLKLLETTLTLHERKLELLKKLKKAYLQRLFPEYGQKTPRLRFVGFTDDWKQHELGSLLKEFSEKSTQQDEYSVLSSTNNGMEKRSGRVSGTTNVGYKIIVNGDLVLSPQNLWLGNININNIGIGLVSPSYKSFRIRNVIPGFLQPQLRSPKMLFEYKNSSTQGASVVRRNLDVDSFNQIAIALPEIEEQRKIAQFFNQLSQNIIVSESQIENLKLLKKEYLRKLLV